MRKAEKAGYVRGTPQAQGEGVEILRWSTSGGAHWCSLRECVHPTLGAHWNYDGDGFAGGYTQSEGFDRQRVIGALARQMERAHAISGNRMQVEFNIAKVDIDHALAAFASPSDAFLVTAQWLGVPNNFFSARVEEVARSEGESAERIDAMKCAGLKANILYLARQDGECQSIRDRLASVERAPAITPADSAAYKLIEQLRSAAAEQAFQDYDFGDIAVEDADGWEHVVSASPTAEYSRKVYIEPAEGDGPTETASFTVRFQGASVIPAEVSALLMSNGQEIGFMSKPDDSPALGVC